MTHMARVEYHTGLDWSRDMPDAETAAAHLEMLMKADGYEGDPKPALLSGQPVTHKAFVYHVDER